jgi:hypothetical protein
MRGRDAQKGPYFLTVFELAETGISVPALNDVAKRARRTLRA